MQKRQSLPLTQNSSQNKRVTRQSLNLGKNSDIKDIKEYFIQEKKDINKSKSQSPTKSKNNQIEQEVKNNTENEQNENDVKLNPQTTTSTKKRGRKSKAELELLKELDKTNENETINDTVTCKESNNSRRESLRKSITTSISNTSTNSRGRSRLKMTEEAQPQIKKFFCKKETKLSSKKVEEILISSDDEEVENDDSDDEEFKINDEQLENTDEEDDDHDIDENDNDESDISEESYDNKKKKKKQSKSKSTSRQKQSKLISSSQFLEITSNLDEIDTYDINQKIEKWDYELEPENKYYTRPILPNLSEKALNQFLSDKSRPPKSIIYECPFCKAIYTYQLAFKSHIFSCPENKNVPEYNLNCAFENCDFQSKRRQEMVKHYIDSHVEHIEKKLTESKKSQLEVSRYFYINRNEYKYAFDYLHGLLGKKYKRLKFIDTYFYNIVENNLLKPDFVLNYEKNDVNLKSTLKFRIIENNDSEELEFDLKPFHIYNQNDVIVINLNSQITAMDWAHMSYQNSNDENASQYLAVSAFPLENFDKILNIPNKNSFRKSYSLQTLYESINLIYIYKFSTMNENSNFVNSFAILNKEIGYISCLKWRPDYGASLISSDSKSTFIGYLMATSSNGNGYIYYVNDFIRTEKTNKKTINIYEPKKELILKLPFSFGQCTSADWSQLNGATQVAIGYSNGSVGLFHLNSSALEDLSLCEKDFSDTKKMYIYPIRTFNAHLTFVKTIKWSKINNFILATGSLFSRETRIWDTRNLEKFILEYDINVTDLAFSIHSADLFMAKDANLKGSNHLIALDLNFNIFNIEKDETRAHSSLFYTYSSMSSIDQSDLMNKLIICNQDGSILLSKSNESKFWTQKFKMMAYSFAQIAKFNVVDAEETVNEKNSAMDQTNYDIDEINKDKIKKTIVINLERVTNNKQNPSSTLNSNLNTKIKVDLNNLVKICWNPNVDYKNWYACGSSSGFVFINKLNELGLKIN